MYCVIYMCIYIYTHIYIKIMQELSYNHVRGKKLK
jgi:hypothetical protein